MSMLQQLESYSNNIKVQYLAYIVYQLNHQYKQREENKNI